MQPCCRDISTVSLCSMHVFESVDRLEVCAMYCITLCAKLYRMICKRLKDYVNFDVIVDAVCDSFIECGQCFVGNTVSSETMFSCIDYVIIL